MLAKNNLVTLVTLVRIKKLLPVVYLSTCSEIKEQKVEVGSYKINYVKLGHGKHHVFFMPGALGTICSHFKPQVEGFDRKKFTIVAWDPPGYGKSRPPEKDFHKNFFEEEADVAYKFMQALNIPKYSVLGWSGGGVTAMIHAAKYQNAVNKLVVIGGFCFILPQDVKTFEKIGDIGLWPVKMRTSMIDVYGKEVFAKYSYRWANGMIDIYKKNNGKLCLDLLKDIQCPTLILHGKKDSIIGKDHASSLLAHIKGSKIHWYPDGKHSMHLQYADDFNRRVQKFLLFP